MIYKMFTKYVRISNRGHSKISVAKNEESEDNIWEDLLGLLPRYMKI